MKSLEIVNREIIFYKEKIKEMKHRENMEDNEYYLYIKECLKEQEQIKQDLEVLEKLKEHLTLSLTGTNKEQLLITTDITNYLSEKDIERFNKIKRWIEENGNERD